MGCPVVDRLGGIVVFEESIGKSRSEAVSAADAIKNLKFWIGYRFVKFVVVPADRAPVIDGGGVDFAKRRGGGLEVREFLYRAFYVD